MLQKLKHAFIGDKRFYKMALAIAIPIMIQNGITNFVSMLDNIMVGNVGTVQMTGVAISNQLIFIFNLAIFGATAGAGIFGAQFYGKGDYNGVRNAFRFKLMIALVISLLALGVFWSFGEDFIMLFLLGEGEVENIELSLRYGVSYLRISLIGLIPFALGQCYSSTLRECGETLLPMKAGIIAVIVNLVGNALLIFGLLFFPELGADGAAWATVISRFVEMFIVIFWTHRHSDRFAFIKGALRSFRVPRELVFSILKKGLPLIANETLWALSIALLNQCYSLRSYDAVSATNICSTLNNVMSISFMALGNAIAIIVGQQLGAGKNEEAIDTANKLSAFATACGVVFGILMSTIAPFFPLIYDTTDSIRALSTELILVMALRMPISALALACYFTLRSGGRAFLTVLLDSVYACAFIYPITLCLALFTDIPLVPLFLISQMLEIGKCILGSIMMKKRIWVRNIVN